MKNNNTLPKELNFECERCGGCCDTYSFWMTNRSYDDDPMEIKRLIEYHGCTPVKGENGELGIRIPITCDHLEFKDGKASCKIHETRPVVCREYFCKKVRDKALMKMLKEVV